MMRDPRISARNSANAFESVPLIPYRDACREARDALEVAELVRTFRKLDPADRAHILKLTRRLDHWHN